MLNLFRMGVRIFPRLIKVEHTSSKDPQIIARLDKKWASGHGLATWTTLHRHWKSNPHAIKTKRSLATTFKCRDHGRFARKFV
jgi:hypothetical protein